MNKKSVNIIISVILVATLAVILALYPSIPDIIPTHWGANGQIDGTGPKYMLFVFWSIAAAVNFLMLFAKKIDPKGENYDRFPNVVNIVRIFITVLLCGLSLLTVGFAFDPQFADMNTIMFVVMGGMFILLGNYMPKVKHNYTFGIKTMWTIASEDVWNKTHRMAGPLWMAGGLVMIAMAFIKNSSAVVNVMIGVILVEVLVPTIYSYIAFQQEKKNKTEE